MLKLSKSNECIILRRISIVKFYTTRVLETHKPSKYQYGFYCANTNIDIKFHC